MKHEPEPLSDDGSSSEHEYRDLAVARFELAGERLLNADPEGASNALLLAGQYAMVVPDIGIVADVANLASKANAVMGRLEKATDRALLATTLLADHPILRGGRQHRQAAAQLYETWELRRQYRYAAEKFKLLADELDGSTHGWQVDLLVKIANHFLSLAAKLRDPDLAERGVKLARPLLDKVCDPDERAAFLQWEAIWNAREDDPDRACELWEASLVDRATTRIRENTRAFPEAHMLVIQGLVTAGAEVLQSGIIRAQEHSMFRYVTAGLTLRSELGLV